MDLKSLKAKAADKIASQEAATVVKGQNLAKSNDEEAPRFYVLKLGLDEGVEVFLSGAKPLIPLQASLVKAFDDLIKIRLNPDWNSKQFWEWARDFEGGFLSFNIGARGGIAKLIKEKTPWGGKHDRRPCILELKKPEKKEQPKKNFYKLVILYPDRTDESKFEIFTGTYKEIANLIINWWNQKASKGSQGSDRNNDIKMLSKHPKIYLFFQEKRPESGARPKRGEISFRLMNETDTTLSVAGLKKLATKIKTIFGGRPSYLWTKGKRYANYNHWELGYKLQLLSPTAVAGEKLIRDILKIQGHEFDKARMTISQNQAEVKAFPSKPGKKKVLGEEVRLPEYRPDCEVEFRYAAVEIGALKSMVVIFSVDSNNPIDSRFRE
jgi:hypothetical protein